MYGFVICEYEKVKEEFPGFKSMMQRLETMLIAHAKDKWGDKYGGFTPTGGQFGKTTIMPEMFYGYGGIGFAAAAPPAPRLVTWNNEFHTRGAYAGQIPGGALAIIEGANTGGTLFEDYMIGLGGIAFLDKAIKVTEIRMQIGDKKLPRINLEEAMAYNKPAVVFEEGFILDEEEGFEMWGYIQSEGWQRIKLIGLQLNRVPNKTQVTDAGALLS